MGSVYQRDIDAYQRAVDQYQRQARRYNNSRVADASGSMVVADKQGNTYAVGDGGKLTPYALPGGAPLSNYGLTELPGDENFRMVRQNPNEKRTVTQNVYGATGYLNPDNPNQVIYNEYDSGPVSPGKQWSAVGSPTIERVDPENSSYVREMQTYQRDDSVYATKPRDFNKKPPTGTFADMRRMNEPTMVQQEAGLIGEVIQGRKPR